MALKKKNNKKNNNKKKIIKPEYSVHTRIENPKILRKEVLSLAIETIQLIKYYREYSEKKKIKIELMETLKRDIKDMKHMLKNIDTYTPINLDQVNNLPYFKKKEKALAEIEKYRQKAVKELEKEKALWEDIETTEIKIPKTEIEKKPEKIEIRKEPEKPKDKVESELEMLRNKLSKI